MCKISEEEYNHAVGMKKKMVENIAESRKKIDELLDAIMVEKEKIKEYEGCVAYANDIINKFESEL